MGKHLHIDPFAGIAGDMFLGACIDLGVPLQAIEEALEPLPIPRPFSITVAETHRHGIRGLDHKGTPPPPGPPASRRAQHQHHHDHDHDHSHDH
ncbi:MAG: nickel insertion protein, partial [Phycisphaeraceae bacterium]